VFDDHQFPANVLQNDSDLIMISRL
jgi:hypothetical protein